MPDGPGGRSEPSSPARVAVVTGATEGLGRALAGEFARGGHDLLLVARTARALEQTAAALVRDHGVRVHVVAADLATPAGCAAVERALGAKGLEAEYLVNNAGVGQCGPFAQADPARLTAIVDLNIRATVDLARRLLPAMIARDAGGILNVASLGGFLPGPHQAAYYASKAFVLSFTEALAHELGGTKVKVAALAPGPVETEFHERMGGESANYIRFQGLMTAESVARIGYNNFLCGQRVIVPGGINLLTAIAVQFLPHTVLTPFTGWLLKRRDENADA